MPNTTLRQAQGNALQTAHQRVTRDLADSERSQRQAAERLAREYVKVLQELAILFDGNRFEALRREDPKAPTYWTPDNWRIFFAEVPQPGLKNGWGTDSPRITELERTLAELRTRLAAAEAAHRVETETDQQRDAAAEKPAQARSKLYTREDAKQETNSVRPLPPAPAAFQVPEGMTPPMGSLLAQAMQVWGDLPSACPTAFQKALSGGGRSGEDLKKAYQRSWLMLHLVGAERLNASFEIEDLISMVCGMSTRPGSLGRIADDLAAGGFLVSDVLRIGSPKTSLRLLKLSPDGVRLFQVLFNHAPLETDWERLMRLHEGERFPEHTLAVLIFALHARKRGWATQVLPPVEGTKAVPDLLILRGEEKLYVEVELGQKESPSKWRNLTTLNDGKVALCAATPETRQRLAGDCRLAKLSGLATDLETLVTVKHSTITDKAPLWAESW